MKTSYFPAEWEEQSAVQLTWPNKNTDWVSNLDAAVACYLEIAKHILKYELLLIVCDEKAQIEKFFTSEELENIRFFEIEYDDTWARDHGGITIFEDGQAKILDFQFNAWGGKFDASQDNLITQQLFQQGAFQQNVTRKDLNQFILEGGALESNGKGIVLTTSKCVFNTNRNSAFSKEEIINFLKKELHAERILCLNHGDVEGDDTDAHIDTLARFVNENTIVYLKSHDEKYPHHQELIKMEEELKRLRDLEGNPFKLIPLKMASMVRDEEGRILPATYANFLIINEAVLAPVYGVQEDADAIDTLKMAFPERKVIPVNCLPLIQQNGSLHCITMQYPKGVVV